MNGERVLEYAASKFNVASISMSESQKKVIVGMSGGRRPLSRAIGGLTALGCIVVCQSEY